MRLENSLITRYMLMLRIKHRALCQLFALFECPIWGPALSFHIILCVFREGSALPFPFLVFQFEASRLLAKWIDNTCRRAHSRQSFSLACSLEASKCKYVYVFKKEGSVIQDKTATQAMNWIGHRHWQRNCQKPWSVWKV